MSDDEPQSLWNYGEPEPWRRGRLAIVLIFAAILVMYSIRLATSAWDGDALQFLKLSLTACFGCLMLYLIWIGQNWARWLLAPFYGFYGLANCIWGVIRDRGDLLIYGIGLLIIFSYLALAPSVYAFAKRQRERTGWLEALVIGAGFLLVLGSIGSALIGFHVYKRSVEQDAVEFAGLTFDRVFINQDAEFLRANASARRRYMTEEQFIKAARDHLGAVQETRSYTAAFNAKVRNWRLALTGGVKAHASFEAGDFVVDIRLSGTERQWAVDGISWEPAPTP